MHEFIIQSRAYGRPCKASDDRFPSSDSMERTYAKFLTVEAPLAINTCVQDGMHTDTDLIES